MMEPDLNEAIERLAKTSHGFATPIALVVFAACHPNKFGSDMLARLLSPKDTTHDR